eukprot:17018_1
MGNTNTNTILTVCYITIQSTITIAVSIIGAIHVYRYKAKSDSKQCGDVEQHEALEIGDHDKDFNKEFCGLWLSVTWKMRGVYSGLAVHSFDVLTDVLVIVQWLNTPDDSADNIDPHIMAYSAIFVMIFSKLVSSFGIYFKERDKRRAVLQFFDLLIFQELYRSHKKARSQFVHRNLRDDKGQRLESTLSFKYVRSLEATFESIPESVLQLVYVMRTSQFEPIFFISILQSIASMTNSMLNNDYTLMVDDKWKNYKKRCLPGPTIEFCRHALSRFAEIVYRIGLLSLIWVVCGGETFVAIMAIEVVFICMRTVWLMRKLKTFIFNTNTVLLSLNSLIVVPSEDVYGISETWLPYADKRHLASDDDDVFLLVSLWNCFVLILLSPIHLLSLPANRCRHFEIKFGFIPFTRLFISYVEFVVLILYGAFIYSDTEHEEYMHSSLTVSIFIATFVFFLTYAQYLILFPDFSLPLRVNVRSRWGLAYCNEMAELEMIKVPKNQTARRFWDKSFVKNAEIPTTAAVFAIASGNDDIVRWLEDPRRDAQKHKGMDPAIAQMILDTNTANKREVSLALRQKIEKNNAAQVLALMEYGAELEKQECNPTIADGHSLLDVMAETFDENCVSIAWLKVFRMVVLLGGRDLMDEKHVLYPLELQCDHGGDLIHLAVSLPHCHLKLPRARMTALLSQVIKDKQEDVNSVNKFGDTALHCIAKMDSHTNIDVGNVEMLLNHGINVSVKNRAKQTVYDIVNAKQTGIRSDIVDLLANAVSPHSLQQMIAQNRFEMMPKLLEIAFKFNYGTYDVLLPIMSETWTNKSMSYEWLIVLRMVVLKYPSAVDKNHRLYPLEAQCKNGANLAHLSVALTGMSDAHVDPSSLSSAFLTRFVRQDIGRKGINGMDGKHNTALHILMNRRVCTNVDIQNTGLLLHTNAGFDLKIQNDDGFTVLDCLAARFGDDDNICVEWLRIAEICFAAIDSKTEVKSNNPNKMNEKEKAEMRAKKNEKESTFLAQITNAIAWNKENPLYPLFMESKRGGKLIHLAVAMRTCSTRILSQLVNSQNNNINSQNKEKDTVLCCILKQNSYNLVDIENIKILFKTNEIDPDRNERAVYYIHKDFNAEMSFDVAWLMVVQMLMQHRWFLEAVNDEHPLNAMRKEYENGGHLIHLAVAINMINSDQYNDRINEVKRRSAVTLKQLIQEEKTDVNAQNSNDETALHSIAKKKDHFTDVDVEYVAILLQNNIDRTIQNLYSRTAHAALLHLLNKNDNKSKRKIPQTNTILRLLKLQQSDHHM